jgi:ABC-type multidrug transport system ATPase subunit
MSKKYKETKTLLYVDNITLGYNGKIVIKDINFTIKDIIREGKQATGQVVAIIGPSGRGKSTLFKALSGLLKPTNGQILIKNFNNEIETSAKLVCEGDIGFVNQKSTLFRHKTIYQICEYALRKSILIKSEKDMLINEYLTQWSLIPHKDKFSNELSGGQKQRVAIIEQMLTSKYFMILDEPFASLDIASIEKAKGYFKKISQTHEDNTIIFSTHDLRLAIEMADVIHVIGFPEGISDYSTIVKTYDLKEMGLAWEPYGVNHNTLFEEIWSLMLKI